MTTEISFPPPSGTPQVSANFGLPVSLLFAVAGAPVGALDGLATAAKIIGTGVATTNPAMILGGVLDSPALILDGLLNGEVLVDMPLPVKFDLPVLGSVKIPVVAHVPFDGLLVPPHPLTATVPITLLDNESPIELTLGGTRFGGLAQFAAITGARTLADSITN
ncbi:hypothetical protein [Mycobacterium sp.]|uniref:hypothetical protein n=1 Tax=Mycobacterium sp. TaxID=1785 RepID=UPI003A868560